MHTSCQSMHPSYRQELWGTRWGVGIGGGEGVRCVPAPGHLNDRSDQLADFISSMVERHIRCAQAVKQGACPRAPCATATAGLALLGALGAAHCELICGLEAGPRHLHRAA